MDFKISIKTNIRIFIKIYLRFADLVIAIKFEPKRIIEQLYFHLPGSVWVRSVVVFPNLSLPKSDQSVEVFQPEKK